MAGVAVTGTLISLAVIFTQLSVLAFGGGNTILPEMERRFGVPRQRIALIDDQIDNVQDMVARGLGLALHVPSEVVPDGESILTCDLASTLQIFQEWTRGETKPKVVTLPKTRRVVMSLRRTGLNTRRAGRHA